MAQLRASEGVTARVVEFAILTAGRSNEVRSAEWNEIEAEAKVWTVPAARMKTRRPHRVPGALGVDEPLGSPQRHQGGGEGLAVGEMGMRAE